MALLYLIISGFVRSVGVCFEMIIALLLNYSLLLLLFIESPCFGVNVGLLPVGHGWLY